MIKFELKKIGFLLISIILLFVSCDRHSKPSPKNPVTITMWHNYVEAMRNLVDELIDEFNRTEGVKNGITVKVTSVADTRVINEQIMAAVNNDPGSPVLPDLALLYPRVAIALAGKDMLVNLEQYFSQEEQASFVPQFIEEGRWDGKNLYIFPINKSVEVLYVNRTLFDRFSKATGVGIEKLSTMEGITEASKKYYEYSGGKQFFLPQDLFNMTMIGFQQMGSDIVKDNKLNLDDPVFQRIWDNYYTPAVTGGMAIFDGYGNYLAATGDIVCATASSAGATFYQGRVIYANNTSEDVVYDVLPYPVFEGGEKVVLQRGSGFCVIKSERKKEYAACFFLKWFTETQRNLDYCAKIGYIPVRKEAFDKIVSGNFPVIENHISEKSLLAVTKMHADYRFYFPPMHDGFEILQNQYANKLRQSAKDGRELYLQSRRINSAQAMENLVLWGQNYK